VARPGPSRASPVAPRTTVHHQEKLRFRRRCRCAGSCGPSAGWPPPPRIDSTQRSRPWKCGGTATVSPCYLSGATDSRELLEGEIWMPRSLLDAIDESDARGPRGSDGGRSPGYLGETRYRCLGAISYSRAPTVHPSHLFALGAALATPVAARTGSRGGSCVGYA
jgi:hypothetical protein